MSLPKTLKAAVVPALSAPLEIREVREPCPAPARSSPASAPPAPATRPACRHGRLVGEAGPALHPGHEGVGEVAAIGLGVMHLKEGDRVGMPWLHTACGRCAHCVAAG